MGELTLVKRGGGGGAHVASGSVTLDSDTTITATGLEFQPTKMLIALSQGGSIKVRA